MKDLLKRAVGRIRRAARQRSIVDLPQVEFDQSTVNRERFERLMQRPAPTQKYVIYFTPRSGSSRITDICSKTKTLSSPGEMFHQTNVPIIARNLGARNLDEYVDVVTRKCTTRGVFGCEMTFGMIKTTFGTPRNFLEHLGGGPSFWLIREDIVAQAVSLSSMVQSRVGHAVEGNEDDVAQARKLFTYDRDDIERWIRHVLNFEKRTEQMFSTFELDPLRLSYETMVALKPRGVANVIARHIGANPIKNNNLASTHKKIGTSKNVEFAQRFRETEAAYLAEVADRRAPYLEKLNKDPLDRKAERERVQRAKTAAGAE